MKISKEDGILILKISVCQSDMVHETCCTNFSSRAGNLKAATVC